MNRSEANTISKEVIAELQAFAKARGITIESAGGKYDDVSLTMKIKIVTDVEKAVEAKKSNVDSICALYNLVPSRAGIKLVDYNSRAYKMPFIYEKGGKRYKCDENVIRRYLAA
jgi:hypothetical protein